MALDLDRAKFFDAVRRQPFAGHLTQPQVAGMEAILAACPPDLGVEKTAYCLATTFHETARTMQPIEEFGRGKGKKYGPTGFWGRGYVQLTWEANYAKATKRLRALGILKASEDLVKTPALAMRPDVAATILFYGMVEGWFTGKALADYFGPGRADPVGARRIINGTDADKLIAGYHAQFRVALLASVRIPDPAPPPKAPDPLAPMTGANPIGEKQPTLPLTKAPPVETKPAPSGGLSSAPSPAAAAPGFWARVHALFSRPKAA
ncbi:hypothetical protein [Methylobacterium symbioticum]|uniref:Glycoside hydrolase family 19 catalytic domain-containing protein n=1 Tax=Methylobacterium symbioticum TaxID=2584084 RepID=A0A509EC27_9HYPH|nr:hypothetical protein [Methylobacterium symbioticum]VUD71797.1 hypothetical protein MET9862_02385 [Methylobacterium symbioticum]